MRVGGAIPFSVWQLSLPLSLQRWSPWRAGEALSTVDSNAWTRWWAPDIPVQARIAMQGFATTTGTLVLYALAVKVPALQPFLKILGLASQAVLPQPTQPALGLGTTVQHPQLPQLMRSASPAPLSGFPWGHAMQLWHQYCNYVAPGGHHAPALLHPYPLWGPSPQFSHRPQHHQHYRALPDASPQHAGTSMQLQPMPMPLGPENAWTPTNQSQRQVAYAQ